MKLLRLLDFKLSDNNVEMNKNIKCDISKITHINAINEGKIICDKFRTKYLISDVLSSFTDYEKKYQIVSNLFDIVYKEKKLLHKDFDNCNNKMLLCEIMSYSIIKKTIDDFKHYAISTNCDDIESIGYCYSVTSDTFYYAIGLRKLLDDIYKRYDKTNDV